MMSKSTAFDKEKQRLAQKDESGFIERNYWLFILLQWVLYPMASLYSAFTEGGHVYTHFLHTSNSVPVALGITIFIVVLIEGGKYGFGKGVATDIREGVFSEETPFKIAFLLKFVGAIVCFGFSIILSIKGSPAVAEHIKEKRDPIDLVSIDSINARYDALILAEEGTISNAQKMKWQGNVTREGQKIVRQATANKQEYEKGRQMEIKSAEAENLRRRGKYESQVTKSGNWYMGFAGLGELLGLLCLFFAGNYESGAQSQVVSPTPRQSISPESEEEYHRLQQEGIGFGTAWHKPKGGNNSSPGYLHGQHHNNKLQPVATDKEMEINIYESALKDIQSNIDAWQYKIDNGIGRVETNQRNITRWIKQREFVQSKLNALKGQA